MAGLNTRRPGLDPERLAELVNLIRQGERYPGLHCLLIIRHGYLVVEEYFNGWQADGLHTLQSVTKSFTSALVGIAIARGEFKGVDEKVLDFFPGVQGIANLDERKASLRLEDLLTMRSGTDFHERDEGSPYRQMMRLTKGWDKFYLDRPMLQPPGTGFLYDSGGIRELEGPDAQGLWTAKPGDDRFSFIMDEAGKVQI